MDQIKVVLREGGPYVMVNTVEEAAALLKAVEPAKAEVSSDMQQRTPEAEKVKRFYASINANARKFLGVLVSHRTGISGVAFAQESGITSDKFGGTMGGMKKIAEGLDLRREDFVLSGIKTEGTSRYRLLTPGPLLVKYEAELARVMNPRALRTISLGA
jgi:hypothetical protein